MEEKEENVWFFIKDHQQQGPVCLFELQKLIEQRILTENTYVWNSSMSCWQTAKTLDQFSDCIMVSKRFQLLSNKFKSKQEYEVATYPQGRPCVRYLARFFDLSLFSMFLISFISIFFPGFIADTSNLLIFILCLILWMIVEPLIITIFGNTFGKALLNTRIITISGERLDFLTALKRSIFVSAAGMGFGIPILNFICFIFSYRDLKGHGISTWDQKIGTIMLYGKVSTSRILLASCLPVGMLAAGFYL